VPPTGEGSVTLGEVYKRQEKCADFDRV